MPKILVLYHSTYGHIERMAEAVAAGRTGAEARPSDPVDARQSENSANRQSVPTCVATR